MLFNKKKLAVFLSSMVLVLGSLSVAAHTKEKVENAVDDSVITTKVKAKLLADPAVSSLNISVDTKKGVVHLKGDLQANEEVSAAVQDAHSIEGVTDVDSSALKVGGKHPVADLVTTAKIMGVYVREKLFGDKDITVMSIHVDTKNGVVSLSGEADNAEQADNAKKLAQSVKGVKEVKSTVTVKK